MPKDEFDFEDPFELNGMALLTHEDTSGEMAECFIEEFLRMGYGPKQLLALFRNPHYLGPNLVYQKRGEPFIRDLIAEVFARWGRPVVWTGASTAPETQSSGESLAVAGTANTELDPSQTDPLGAPIPKLTL